MMETNYTTIMRSLKKCSSSTKKRAFPCDHPGCDKNFKRLYSLKRHQTSHDTIRKHACETCGKRFALFQYLKEHYYIHTGAKPFACAFPGCDKRFRQAGKLSIHKRVHADGQLEASKPRARSDTSTSLKRKIQIEADPPVVDDEVYVPTSPSLSNNEEELSRESIPLSSSKVANSSIIQVQIQCKNSYQRESGQTKQDNDVDHKKDEEMMMHVCDNSDVKRKDGIHVMQQTPSFVDSRTLPLPKKLVQTLQDAAFMTNLKEGSQFLEESLSLDVRVTFKQQSSAQNYGCHPQRLAPIRKELMLDSWTQNHLMTTPKTTIAIDSGFYKKHL